MVNKNKADYRGPLSGLRILAVEQFGAGPFGTLYLADLGADVIKIEDPAAGGDVGRYIPPSQVGSSSLYFEAFNRGKRSVALDLKSRDGREAFQALASTADAVYSNLRGDQAEALKLTYEHLRAVNPQIVCVALTGYGRSGPDAKLPAYDSLIQAETGWASITGEPGGPPTKSGLSLVDFIGGITAALGLVSAVQEATNLGVGRDVDVDLYSSSMAMYTYQAAWYLSDGVRSERQPMSAHPSIVPFQFFETEDGHVAIACGKENFFEKLVNALKVPSISTDARFATFAGRREHREEVLALLGGTLRAKKTQHWLDLLRGSVPIAPVRSMEDALNRDELNARGMLASYESPNLESVEAVGLPIKMSGFAPDYEAAPELGANTLEVLAEAGYDAAGLKALARSGALGKESSLVTERSVHEY